MGISLPFPSHVFPVSGPKILPQSFSPAWQADTTFLSYTGVGICIYIGYVLPSVLDIGTFIL